MEDNFINTVISLYRENNWKEIIKLNEDSKSQYALNLLWVWPSIENLEYIKSKLDKFNMQGVISLGCGCGLFEWLLMQFIGVPVLGYEINREWWESRHSNPLFIPHVYPEFPITEESLYKNYALIFVYFNDGNAFREYVDKYDGDLIIIIGPGEGRGAHTDPEPFTPKFGKCDWTLQSYQEVKTSKDYIATYIRAMSTILCTHC